MICVAIGRSRHKHIMAEHKHLAEQGAKMVELRLDYVAGKVNIRRLMAERPQNCQVIITCRRKEDGGKWQGTEDARQLLLREAIAEGVDWVDLEARPSGSSATTTSARRPTTFASCTRGWRRSIPTS
jgi:3-dehydroquinate dehydratase/shikimate dehydrogenase